MKEARFTYPLVSVIVPVYDDWARLELCLAALLRQSYPREFLQIIVVDNEEIPGVGRAKYAAEKGVELIHEARPGSYAARNAGLNVAAGEIIAFTDSDCIPKEDWIERGVQSILHGYDRVAGKVELFFASNEPNCVELYEETTAFQQETYVIEFGGCATANLLTRREVLDATGGFDEGLFSGGDLEWGVRASKLGFDIHYAEDVVVRHPARRSWNALLKRRRRVLSGVSSYNSARAFKEARSGLAYAFVTLSVAIRKIALPYGVVKFVWRLKSYGLRKRLCIFMVAYVVSIYSEWASFALKYKIVSRVR